MIYLGAQGFCAKPHRPTAGLPPEVEAAVLSIAAASLGAAASAETRWLVDSAGQLWSVHRGGVSGYEIEVARVDRRLIVQGTQEEGIRLDLLPLTGQEEGDGC
jgi:hypothetical protein